ncbi:Protein DEL-7 [Aphelenchoides avenae]|nr:Protein DEL-7 [Aphelenchus avenae]
MRKHMGRWTPREEKGIRELVAYAIAGAGFHNMEKYVDKFSTDDRDRLARLFLKWLDGRSLVGFYRTLFERLNYTCRELFDRCYYGKHPLNCCDIFESTYVMLRGRCFRLKKFYQADPDIYGKLLMTVRQLPSWFIDKSGLQPQIVTFISDPKLGQAATFPRFYFNTGEWNQLIFKRRDIKMLDTNPQCNSDCKHCGKTRCYIGIWLYRRVIRPLNCTLFYERHMSPPGLRVCDPSEIVRTYTNVTDTSLKGTQCLPDCDREDITVKLISTQDIGIDDRHGKKTPTFRIDAFFSELEVERYEEVRTTTVPGFVAELGGQSNLFLGFSIITAVHAIRCLVLALRSGLNHMCRDSCCS